MNALVLASCVREVRVDSARDVLDDHGRHLISHIVVREGAARGGIGPWRTTGHEREVARVCPYLSLWDARIEPLVVGQTRRVDKQMAYSRRRV